MRRRSGSRWPSWPGGLPRWTPGSTRRCPARWTPTSGVKDGALPDTLYVTELVAPGTVNTMPEKTLQAVDDHAKITGDTITGADVEAQQVLDDLKSAGIDYNDVVRLLEEEGLSKFEDAWTALLEGVTEQLDKAGAPTNS